MNNLFTKLEQLKKLPDGLVESFASPLHRILVVKKDNQIQVYFADPHDLLKPKISGIMSRIDLDNPLNLLGIYPPAIMLSLVWISELKLVYMLGFAGGRIPFILRYYFPQAIVESTDIEPAMKEIAEKYFGVIFDENQKLFIQDGREYLENQSSDKKYNIIIIDAFRGSGYTEKSLGVEDFYELCKKHLTENGVVCANMVDTDPLFFEKKQFFNLSFKNVYLFQEAGNYVFFGNEGEKLNLEEIQKRSREIQLKYQFIFPFVDRVRKLMVLH